MTIKYKKKSDMTLGKFLKAQREGEEYTQLEFAKLLGISKQRLCDLEHDRFNVSIKLGILLAKKLDLPKEWLVKIILEKQLKDENIDLKVG